MSKNWMLLVPVLLLAACAGNPANEAAGAKQANDDRNCLRETGSKVEREGCAGHGRTVTREELERSGGQNTTESLKRVIP